MRLMFARVLSALLCLAFAGAAMIVLVKIRPESAGGYAALALLVALAFIAPLLGYRALMARWRRDHPGETRAGAGLAMGAALEQGRRRREESDEDIDFAPGD